MVTPQPVEQKVLFGQMVLTGKFASAFPLERTEVTGQLTGLFATVAVKQTFRNPLEKAAELEYLFPLPETAAVFDFELTTGDRTIRGEVRELDQAREEYDRSRRQGKQAALVESRRRNLFAIRVANVLPGHPIVTTLRYQEKLKYDSGCFEFVFPMGITPKFDHPDHPGEGEGVHAPVAKSLEEVGPVEIELSVQAGLPVADPESPSHPLKVTRLDETRFAVHLGDKALPNHDFVLRYRPLEDQSSLAAWVTSAESGDYFVANLLPPYTEPEEIQPAPRDFVFVLDRSGSMTGQPIAQARNALRACLRALNPADTFRILLFDHTVEWFRDEPSKMTQSEIEAADEYLGKVEGRGGTDIVAALEQALQLPEFPERTRYIVFLTDGAVSAEDRALARIRQQLGNARVFTFGIGPSVNRALLNRLAQLGRGAAEFLQLDEDIEGAIIRFQDRVSFPALTDLEMHWTGASAWDVYPSRLPDLYFGQPVEIAGRVKALENKPEPRLEVHGRMGGKEVTLSLAIPREGAANLAVSRVWARARIDDLLEKAESGAAPAHQLRGEIISLSIEHRLITPFTAFVAVDNRVVSEGGSSPVITISQPLPEGLEIGGFAGIPPVASAAPRGFLNAAMMPPAAHIIGDSMGPVLNESFQAPRSKARVAKESMQMSFSERFAQRPEEILRSLIRTQQVNGSWDNHVEMTAAVLMLLLRRGQTTHKGDFRKQMRKAVEWLANVPTTGTPAFLRAAVLKELAQATGQSSQQELARTLAGKLPAPSSPIERDLLGWMNGQAVSLPEEADSLDRLRLAAVLNRKVTVAPEVLKGKDQLLADLWSRSIG